MKLKGFYIALFLAVYFFASDAYANERSILVVHSQRGVPYDSFSEPLFKLLKEHVPNIVIKEIVLNNHEKHIARLLAKIDYSDVELAVAIGTVALRGLKSQRILNEDTPIVFGVVTDPVGEGVISGFNKSVEGNITGVSYSVDIKDRIRYMLEVFPKARKIGVIYSTMPQSISYKQWLTGLKKDKEFSDLTFIYRRVGMIADENGPFKMVRKAQQYVADIKEDVDVFIAPNDQMGVLPEFSQMVVKTTGKPVFGLAKNDVEADMAAVASASPKIAESAHKVADIVIGLLDGKPITDFPPQRPDFERLFNSATAKKFGVNKPEK